VNPIFRKEESRMPVDAAPPPGGPESPAGKPDSKEAPGVDWSPKSRPQMERVMQDISTALEELKAIARETDLQAEAGQFPAEGAPEADDRHYRDLFESAPDAFLVTDAQIIIQECNQAAAAMFQAGQAFLSGKPLSGFIAAEDRAAFQAGLIRLREGGEKRNWEFRLQSGEGPPVTVLINVRALTDHHDKLVRMLWLLRDAGDYQAEAETLRSLLGQMKSCLHGAVEALADAVEMKDPQNAGHQRRVAQLAVAIAREMDFSLNRLEGIKIAGLLHDIGKIAVPTEILSKPGLIGDLELELMKSHCRAGFDLLKNIGFPWPVREAVLQHHERLDGSGYPAGLTEADIILEARILGVADVVETMVRANPYGPGQGIDEALEEIRQNAGILYDPVVVNACLKLFLEKGFNFNS
jgi:PAS domain S-box-containing protein/putative nucleotidyltransferase with HDIG domain